MKRTGYAMDSLCGFCPLPRLFSLVLRFFFQDGFFRHAEHLADGVVEPFRFGIAGN